MVLRLPQGQTTSSSTATASNTGQLVRSTGRTKRDRPMPLENQIAISLSRYIRPSVSTMATNSDNVIMMGRLPKAA